MAADRRLAHSTRQPGRGLLYWRMSRMYRTLLGLASVAVLLTGPHVLANGARQVAAAADSTERGTQIHWPPVSAVKGDCSAHTDYTLSVAPPKTPRKTPTESS